MKRLPSLIANSILLLSLFQLGSCVTPISIDIDRRAGQLVIDGFITEGEGPQFVRLSRASQENRISVAESGALVILHDDEGNSETLTDLGDGNYEFKRRVIQPQEGHAYHLELTLQNGVRYATRPDTMPSSVGRDSAWYTIGSLNGLKIINIMTRSEIPASEKPVFLRWAVGEVYQFSPTDFPDPWNSIPPSCYVTGKVNPQRLSLYDGSRFQISSIEAHQVAQRKIDHTMLERHFFFIYQRSISEAAFRYWEQVDLASNQSGSLFDVPPAAVRGNAYRIDSDEQVLGIFSAVKQDTTFFDTWPAEFKDLVFEDPCLYTPFKRYSLYPSECLNCLDKKGSSYTKPPYFF